MKLYKYWAAGEAIVHHDKKWTWKVRAYGGSNDSPDEAMRRANERAGRTAAALERGDPPGSYGYSDRPLREELIEEIRAGDEVSAVITRNCYGALVLNTNRVMFIDVDFYPPSERSTLGSVLRDMWNTLLGKAAVIKQDREQRVFDRIEDVCRAQPNVGFRIYRTAAGFRLLVTSQSFDPASIESAELLTAFGSDPLYVRLCKAQECFRARLSAKFWRCRMRRPPSRFPWADPAKEREYRAWEEDYHASANRFAVCEFIGHRGVSDVDESVRPILETHDRLTMLDGAKLA